MISVRPATLDDVLAYAGGGPPDWCIEWVADVAERDGRSVALGTVYRDKWGRCWVAFDKKEPVPRFLMHRMAKRTIARLREIGIDCLFAECDERIAGAAMWLERLGFKPGERTDSGRLIWRCDL